ncbi:MAG: YihY/virulence factor BrkB family protein [Candidatus Latescibacterota bacterium]
MVYMQFLSLLKKSFGEGMKSNVSVLAAALAYYTIFSIAPLFIFFLTIVSLMLSRTDAQALLLQNLQPFIAEPVVQAINDLLNSIQNPPATIIATAFGLLTLILGTTQIILHLRYSLNKLWMVPSREGIGIFGEIKREIKTRFSTFLIVIGIGIFFVALVIASAYLTTVAKHLNSLVPTLGFVLQIFDFLISVGLATLLFAVVFKIIPDAKIAWSDVWIGSMVTAFLFSLGKFLLGMYFTKGAITSVYGAAGSLVIIILWLYYSAQIFFFGAEFIYVYSIRFGSRQKKLRSEPNPESEEEHLTWI